MRLTEGHVESEVDLAGAPLAGGLRVGVCELDPTACKAGAGAPL